MGSGPVIGGFWGGGLTAHEETQGPRLGLLASSWRIWGEERQGQLMRVPWRERVWLIKRFVVVCVLLL